MTCPCGMPSFGFPECYYHAKSHVDWTTRPPTSNGLSLSQRSFVGLFPTPRARDGWHNPDLEPYGTEDSNDYLTPAERSLLAFLATSPDMEID